MRVEFQGELDALEAGFQETGEIVLRSIRGVVDALRTQDVELRSSLSTTRSTTATTRSRSRSSSCSRDRRPSQEI